MGMPITEELIFELMNKKIWALVEKSRLIYCRLPYPPFHHQKKEERWSVACLVFSSVRYKASLPSFWAAKLNPMMWTQEFHARICRLITSNYCSFLLFKVEPPKKKKPTREPLRSTRWCKLSFPSILTRRNSSRASRNHYGGTQAAPALHRSLESKGVCSLRNLFIFN